MRFCLSLSFIALTLAAAFPAGNWPEFRGPTGDGISNTKGLPVEWSEQKNIRWKTALPGRGHYQPIDLQ